MIIINTQASTVTDPFDLGRGRDHGGDVPAAAAKPGGRCWPHAPGPGGLGPGILCQAEKIVVIMMLLTRRPAANLLDDQS